MSSPRLNRHHQPPVGDGGGVIPCGDGFIYSLGGRLMGALAPKSSALERQLRAIPGVSLVDAEPEKTNAVLPAIRLVEVRGALLAQRDPGRKPDPGPTVTIRRGRLW